MEQFKEFDLLHPCERLILQVKHRSWLLPKLIDDWIPTSSEDFEEWSKAALDSLDKGNGHLFYGLHKWKKAGEPTYVVEEKVFEELTLRDISKKVDVVSILNNDGVMAKSHTVRLLEKQALGELKGTFLWKRDGISGEKLVPRQRWESAEELLTHWSSMDACEKEQHYLTKQNSVFAKLFKESLSLDNEMRETANSLLPESLMEIDYNTLYNGVMYVKLPASSPYCGFLVWANPEKKEEFDADDYQKTVWGAYLPFLKKKADKEKRKQKKRVGRLGRYTDICKYFKEMGVTEKSWIEAYKAVLKLIRFHETATYSVILFQNLPKETPQKDNLHVEFHHLTFGKEEIYKNLILEFIVDRIRENAEESALRSLLGISDKSKSVISSDGTTRTILFDEGVDLSKQNFDPTALDKLGKGLMRSNCRNDDRFCIINFVSNFLMSLQRTSIRVGEYRPKTPRLKKERNKRGRKVKVKRTNYRYLILDTETKEVIQKMMNKKTREISERKEVIPHERRGRSCKTMGAERET